MPDIGSPKRPEEISPRLHCFACQVMIEYAVKALGKRTGEADVVEVVDQNNICNPKNYDGSSNSIDIDLKGISPKILTDPCEAILGSYEDELIETLRTRFEIKELDDSQRSMLALKSADEVVKFETAGKFCNNDDSLTRACFNIRPELEEGQGAPRGQVEEPEAAKEEPLIPQDDEEVDDGRDIEDLFNEEL